MRLRVCALAAFVAFAMSCEPSGRHSAQACMPPARELLPLVVGDTFRLQPGTFAVTSDCEPVVDPSFSWGSRDSAVVLVRPDGLAHGLAPGVFRIQAVRGNDTLHSKGFVLPRGWYPRIEPESARIVMGDSVSFRVVAYDQSGTPLPTVPFWLLSESFARTARALVPAAGLPVADGVTQGGAYQNVMVPGYFRGERAGTTTITGVIGTRRVRARLVVVPPPSAPSRRPAGMLTNR